MAPATAPGGPVGIVRVSGRDLGFLEPMLGGLPAAGSFSYRKIKNPYLSANIDSALVLNFQSPYSFTGENVVEIHCHGVPSVLSDLCNLICSLGAKFALPGEFSFRAVLNGKMTLEEAEALQTALSVEGIQSTVASKLLGANGDNARQTTDALNVCLEEIQKARGRVEAAIDFPEAEQEQSKDIEDALRFIGNVELSFAQLINSHENFCLSRGEARVALVGETNVGKSTLFNILCSADRAIVSDVAGTTRDVIEARVRLPSGRWIRLIDTAGIRTLPTSTDSPHDKLEKAGIEKGVEASQRAQLMIHVRKLSEQNNSHEQSALSSLYIYSHADQARQLSTQEGAFDFIHQANLVRSWVMEKADQLLGKNSEESTLQNSLLISGRQERLIQMASHEIAFARKGLQGELPIELAADHLREAEKLLKKTVGQNLGEEYISQIFSQFCLGK